MVILAAPLILPVTGIVFSGNALAAIGIWVLPVKTP
jgi:hypothetical protein